ncbi:unnamed protein product [Pedinophyceae sp. YPF-701]|nr:unnamed protein product [Pedinophyceae sp. YPF-701]
MYCLSSYYVASMASTLPLDCFYPALFVVLVYWMGGLRADAGAFVVNLLTVVLMVLIGQSYGLLIGASVMKAKRAQTIATIVMLSSILVSGFYVTFMPAWIEWVQYLSFMYWGFRLLLKVQYADIGDAVDIPLSFPDVRESPVGEAMVLVGWLVALRVIIFYLLVYKTRKV